MIVFFAVNRHTGNCQTKLTLFEDSALLNISFHLCSTTFVLHLRKQEQTNKNTGGPDIYMPGLWRVFLVCDEQMQSWRTAGDTRWRSAMTAGLWLLPSISKSSVSHLLCHTVVCLSLTVSVWLKKNCGICDFGVGVKFSLSHSLSVPNVRSVNNCSFGQSRKGVDQKHLFNFFFYHWCNDLWV